MKKIIILIVVVAIVLWLLLSGGNSSVVSVSPEEAPVVDITVEKDVVGGWNLFLNTENFTFSPQNVGGEHVLGEGYANLLINGIELTRVYGNSYHIGSLKDGTNEVSVVLMSNNHKPYSVDGISVGDSEPVEVGEASNEMAMNPPAQAGMEGDSMEMDHSSMDMEDSDHMMEADHDSMEMSKEDHAHAHDSAIMVGSNMSVNIEVFEDSIEGWNVQITTSGFKFTPENASGAHVAGEGHAHIYEDGVKLGRVYTDWYYLKSLNPGAREVLVNLNSNNHSPYATHAGVEIEDSEVVDVPGIEAFRRSAESFDIEVSERSQDPQIITVNEGDNVVLNITSDESGEYHVSGYEIEKSIDVENATEIAFVADKAGRYNLELHPTSDSGLDLEIGALVVNPN